MAKTFGKRFKNNKEGRFIGRGEHITIFNNNLKSDDYIPIFNIHGQGGVGKTFLSKHYRTFVDEAKGLSAYSDESIKSILEWMDAVSKQFREQKAELDEFDKRYKVFLQETKKLESDPEKPKGTFGDFMKGLSKGAIKEIKKLPGAELVGSFVNEDAVAETIGNWSEFVRKRLTNKDEVELVLDPVKSLTPLFWKDILAVSEKHKFICFFIDTFEETDTFLETWLLDLLNEKYGDILPGNLLLVISGRDTLDPNRWSAHSDIIHIIPLEPFSLVEAQDFLTLHGISDDAVRSDILKLSGCLPVLLDWLTNAAKTTNSSIEDACETAVERFLHWVTDDSQRQIALDAALARKLNTDVLAAFLSDSTQAKPLFDWLCRQPFVLKRGNYWTYHGVVREQMLRYVRTHSPQTWAQKHLVLAGFYQRLQDSLELKEEDTLLHSKWLEYEYERLYHLLCARPDKHIPVAIDFFVKKFYESGLSTSADIGDILFNAGIDNEHDITEGWGLNIKTALEGISDKNFNQIQMLIQNILSKNWINDKPRHAFLLNLDGLIYSAKGDKDKAIESYQKAIDIKPDKHEAYGNLGFAFIKFGEIEKAASVLSKRIELGNTDTGYMNLGHVYLAEGMEEQAIINYRQSLAAFSNKEAFWEGMKDDFQYLEQYGITRQQYDLILKEITGQSLPENDT